MIATAVITCRNVLALPQTLGSSLRNPVNCRAIAERRRIQRSRPNMTATTQGRTACPAARPMYMPLNRILSAIGSRYRPILDSPPNLLATAPSRRSVNAAAPKSQAPARNSPCASSYRMNGVIRIRTVVNRLGMVSHTPNHYHTVVDQNRALRDQLVKLLEGGTAHADFHRA